MLPYQPNSESCLIGCYNTEEMEPKNFPTQVANFTDLHHDYFLSNSSALSFALLVLPFLPFFLSDSTSLTI